MTNPSTLTYSLAENIKTQSCRILMRSIVTAEAYLLWQLSGLHSPGGLRAPAVHCHSYAEQQRYCQDAYSHCKSCHNTCKRDFIFLNPLLAQMHGNVRCIRSISSPVLSHFTLNPHSASQSSVKTSCISSVNTVRGHGFKPLHPGTEFG